LSRAAIDAHALALTQPRLTWGSPPLRQLVTRALLSTMPLHCASHVLAGTVSMHLRCCGLLCRFDEGLLPAPDIERMFGYAMYHPTVCDAQSRRMARARCVLRQFATRMPRSWFG
jgi:hypothetical protein